LCRAPVTISWGGPPLVKAATGEEVTAEELGGADVHSRLSGVTDHLAADDEHPIAICREIVSHLGDPPPEPWERHEPADPALDPAELHGVVPADIRHPFEVRGEIWRIRDGPRAPP